MSLSSPRPVFPPDNQCPEVWLSQYDNEPTVLPVWLPSRQVAVVGVYELARGDTEACVLPTRAQLQECVERVMSQDKVPWLFFVVPREILFEAAVCPGLDAAAFDQ